MSGETTLTVIGNLTADPELRYTGSGTAVASFTIASTPRVFDRASNEWRDGDPLFLRCVLWRQAAENACESLPSGTRVMVTGRLRQRSYDTAAGQTKTVVELDVEEVGPSLRQTTATVHRANRRGGTSSSTTDDQWTSEPPSASAVA